MKNHLFIALGLGSLLTGSLHAESACIEGSCSSKYSRYSNNKEYAAADENNYGTPQNSSRYDSQNTSRNPAIKIINTKALNALINSKNPPLLVDARTQSDNGKKLPGAKSLPFTASPSQINEALPNKDAPIIVYCSNPRCPSARSLAEKLSNMGYTNIQEYPEGIEGWIAAGHKTEPIKQAHNP